MRGCAKELKMKRVSRVSRKQHKQPLIQAAETIGSAIGMMITKVAGVRPQASSTRRKPGTKKLRRARRPAQ